MADDGVDLNESIDGDGVDLDKTIDYDALDLDNSMNDDAIELYRSIDDDFMKVTGARKFSYEDLVSATNNFSENEKLGKGGFGSVYRGFLKELDCYVAVKRVSSDSEQGVKEYASEVKIISQLRHENIVQLMGWCHERKELLLVYEFMPNGSLDFHLFKDNSLLSWEMRYKIARGLASGLLYLHHKRERYVVHRDIKASNIMLDSSFTAKIGDFGLARLGDHGKSLEYTPLAGTVGYVAWEYAITGRASKESDVYSFGIVALEIACGRKVIDRQAIREGQRNLREWVWDLYGKGKILEAADPRLDGEFDKQQVECLMMVGLWCAHPDPKLRSTIENAIHVLNFAAPVPDLPSEMPMFSYFGPFSSSSRSSITASSQGSKISGNSQFSSQILPTPILRIFSYAELGAATNKFITHAVADTRALGNVLKGRLDDEAPGKAGTGTLIAVKKLKYENLQGFEPWQSEVNFLGRLSHPNLVKLIGYCWEHMELQLVYEFMQNWSLEYQLSRRGGSYFQPLPWDTRIKIAIGAARGLAFLHTLDMIHGNFKASNILLDGSYTAKISDFGLAKFEASDSDDFPYLVTRMMGNYGCAAPEYVATGHLYKKSDVYGFGVVLMEILTGLRAYDRNRPFVERNLVNWIKPYLYNKRKLNRILDSRLEGTYPLKAAVRVAQLALNCIESEPNRRPSMKEVVETLERIAATTDRSMVPRVRSNRSATHHHGHQP